MEFRGVYTAIVTPFQSNGTIDWAALEKLVEFQISNKVTGVLPCGTTGESPTLSHSEQLEVIKRVVGWVKGRCQVMAGTGSNNTAHAVELSKAAQELGADACLVVNPYYNKPTQEGLYRHFKAVCNAVQIPVILYNIKGRTGVNVETATLLRIIQDCKNLAGVKEASGDIAQIREVIQKTPESFAVLSGDDNLTLEVIKSGGDGVISVASNLVPDRVVALCQAALNGDLATAEKLHNQLMPLFEGIFIETNPIPIKAALSIKGMCRELYRLPLCEMRPENREKIEALLRALAI